jgi:hypothetical protein
MEEHGVDFFPRLFEFALKIKGETTVGLASEG